MNDTEFNQSTILDLLRSRGLAQIMKVIQKGMQATRQTRIIRSVGIALIERDQLWKEAVNPDTGKYFTRATDYFKSSVVQDDLRLEGNRHKLSEARIEGRVLLLLQDANIINLETFDISEIGGWVKLQYFELAMKKHGNDIQTVFEQMKKTNSSKDKFIAFAQGQEVSYRSENHKKQVFQRYFLAYPIDKEAVPG